MNTRSIYLKAHNMASIVAQAEGVELRVDEVTFILILYGTAGCIFSEEYRPCDGDIMFQTS